MAWASSVAASSVAASSSAAAGALTARVAELGVALHEAGVKVRTAVRELRRHEDDAGSYLHRFIAREVEQRLERRGPAYWDQQFPGLPPEARAAARIRRMLTRATVAGVVAGAGATAAELLSIGSEGVAAAAAVPLGIVSVGAEMLYTTALEIDLAFDLATIYNVPFERDAVGEIATMLGLALGVGFNEEPSVHDQPTRAGETKPWRVLRQMQRGDFSKRVSKAVVQQSVLRNVVPVAGVVVGVVWNQIVLRRFARAVHTAMRQRVMIARAFERVKLDDPVSARIVLDGAWLLATVDGAIGHREALALSTLIRSLGLPERIAASEPSVAEDEEGWFERLRELEPKAHDVLLEVLALVASTDGEFTTAERRFLRRVAKALGRDIDLVAVEANVARLRVGRAFWTGEEPAKASAPQAEPAAPLAPELVPALS
jgi:tellurite resistance protein